MKWGLLDDRGRLASKVALPLDDRDAWERAIRDWGLRPRDSWAVSSVNPPVAEALGRVLSGLGSAPGPWYRSARDVAFGPGNPPPEGAGADRALAVLAAKSLIPPGSPGLVISCGTAITFERIGPDGRWEGGAIAAGLGMVARALRGQTAQLPLVELHDIPDPWGDSTASAIAAGIYWGTVGAVRELIARQAPSIAGEHRLWTGGDARLLAPAIEGEAAVIVPDLVLAGVALAAFSVPPGQFLP